MSHFDDPYHARTSTTPPPPVTRSMLDRINEALYQPVDLVVPAQCTTHQNGYLDSRELHGRTRDPATGDPSYSGPPSPVPEALKQPPIIPGSVTRANLERVYLSGVYTYWFEEGAAWGKKHAVSFNAEDFALPEDIFNRIISGKAPIRLPTNREIGFMDALNLDEEPTQEQVFQLKWRPAKPVSIQFPDIGRPIEYVEDPAYTVWVKAAAEAEAAQRTYLYRIALVRGVLHGQEMVKQLAEQVARGGASAGRTSKFDQGA